MTNRALILIRLVDKSASQPDIQPVRRSSKTDFESPSGWWEGMTRLVNIIRMIPGGGLCLSLLLWSPPPPVAGTAPIRRASSLLSFTIWIGYTLLPSIVDNQIPPCLQSHIYHYGRLPMCPSLLSHFPTPTFFPSVSTSHSMSAPPFRSFPVCGCASCCVNVA